METEKPAPAVTVAEWLDRVRTSLHSGAESSGPTDQAAPPTSDPAPPAASPLTLPAAEQRLLLELARIAARASERIAAPLSTYLAGVALGALPPQERAAALATLVRNLDTPRDL